MWFRSLFDALSARSSRTLSRKRRPVPRVRPLLEILEDRTLLSTYVVTSLTDTGTGSGLTGDLRYCITHATSGNDTIAFGVTGTISLQSPLPTMNASVAIQGPGANKLTVTAEAPSLSPFFTVGNAAIVQISGLTLENAEYSTILNNGSVVASNMAFTYSDDAGNDYAIDNQGSATVSNSSFADNSGGIYNNGTLDVSNCTFSGNYNESIINNDSATVSDSTISGCQGGAMANGGNLTVNSCILSDNGSIALYNYTTAKLTVNNSTISGNANNGIYNAGSATVNNSTISGNKVVGPAGYEVSFSGTTPSGGSVIYGFVPGGNGQGGGLYIASGTVTINNSTFADNQALGGAGGAYYGDIAGNGQGGGLYIASGTVTINNSTFADNQALGGSGWPSGFGYGGGIYNAAGPGALQMHDTILADNTADSGPDLSGSVASLGHNLIGNTSGGSGFVASDLLNVNPQLGPLQNNGGPTQTMALLPGSPAINAGDNTNAPAYDQRGPGFARIVGGIIDIGAFEVQNGNSNQASSLIVSGFPSTITAGNAGSFTVTAKNADGTTDISYTGTVQFTSSDGQAVLPADYTFTAADAGVHTFSAALKTAGTQSITVTDTATPSLTSSEGGITVKPAAASKFILSAPSQVNPGVPFSLTVTVEDAYGNVVTGYTGTIHFSSTDSRAKLPATYTFTASDNGAHTFTGLVLRKAGSQKITITDTHNTSLTGSTIVDVL